MSKMQKDEILERLVFSDGLVEAYARPERERSGVVGDHWTGPVLLERIAYLRKLARFSEGSARETIREFPGYSLVLMALLRSGDAVADGKHGYTFLVLDGRATLVTGGTVDRARMVAEGEFRGSGISGGDSQEVQRGDVVHVKAGVPHQFLLAGDKSFSSLVIRIDENAGTRS